MRIYEELFIVKPETAEEEIDAFNEQLRTLIVNHGGTVDKIEKWGKRRLAYKVDKFREGHYTLIQFSSGATGTVKELERRMRVTDNVLKFLTVRIDESMKRIEKRRKQREKRASRRAVNTPATPQPSVAQQMLGGEPHAAPGAPVPPLPGAPVQS